MRYWFSGTSVMLLLIGVLSLSARLAGGISVGYWHNWFVFVGGIFCLTGAYCVIRRRHAVARFNSIFGFMPSPERGDERFRHLVEGEIRSRAEALRNAYRERDTRRDARRMAANATAASSLQQDYELTDRIVDECHRRFYKAIDVATSRWLPCPYTDISRELKDWVRQQDPFRAGI